MFQNKKLKCNATSAIAEVALFASNCALPTSDLNVGQHKGGLVQLRLMSFSV